MEKSKGVSSTFVGGVVVALVVGLVLGLVAGPSLFGVPPQTITLIQTVTREVGGAGAVTITATPGPTTVQLAGSIEIDGSSTVYPITEAVAEAFMKIHRNVDIKVGISGTGGGFKRFVIGETDINDASRPITKSEAEAAAKNGIEWFEVPIAIDALVVVVNKAATWVDCIAISELKRIWEPESKVRLWSDVRPEWPAQPIRLYGPGPDSGTFDYFTERVVGKAKASRTDYIASEDDNVLVAGVERETYALGYFGYAYYPEAKDKIKALKVQDDEAGGACIEPGDETAKTFVYPLARPLFLYVSKKAWDTKPHLREFIYFYLENGPAFVKKVQYTPFPDHYYVKALALIKSGIYTGLYELTRLKNENAGPR
uniref:PstS family phosphate ABC transporter substrate-binding protein n=1 Tax=Caldiarchaeum subterraneum TaxID=311458 RepID=A0A7C5U4I7_CALS0